MNKESEFYDLIADDLCNRTKYKVLYHNANYNSPLPSIDTLTHIVDDLKEILFLGFFGHYEQHRFTLPRYVSHKLEVIQKQLEEQITCGICFSCTNELETCEICEKKASVSAKVFIERLPHIK
ncbi:MAG: hypothetical protein WCL06_13480, partial [Bacteroidota bacterium]